MYIKLIVIIVSAILFSACGATKLSKSDKSDIDAGKKALIKTYNQSLIGAMLFDEQPVTQILSVDGKKIDSEVLKLDEQIAVNVGSHSVEFSCTDRSGHNEKDYSETIQLEVKAYHQYLVRCSFDSGFGANGSYEGSFSVKEKRLK